MPGMHKGSFESMGSREADRLLRNWNELVVMLEQHREGASKDWITAAEQAVEEAELAYRRAVQGSMPPLPNPKRRARGQRLD
jgi:hypothetical protein